MRAPRTLGLVASVAVAATTFVAPFASRAATPNPGMPGGREAVLPNRQTAPVVLTGAQLPGWSDAAATGTPMPYPYGAVVGERSAHNGVTVAPPAEALVGVRPDDIAAFRWDAAKARFVEIPVQVDQRFPYFLANPNSDFGVYSGTDTELTYQWDVESWKMTDGTCHREYPAGEGATADPVPTLDADDEVVLMASDTGPQAPVDALGPVGSGSLRQEVAVTDPTSGAIGFAYLFTRAGGSGFDAGTGYVDYQRAADADQWIDRSFFADDDPEKLGSSNTGYGPNLSGTVCDPATGIPRASTDRFPRDGVTVSTDAYRWTATGRWMVRGMQVAKPGQPGVYGPDLIDRWKGRAFQSSPDSSISVVGFEDEQVNWEANSALLGERQGPVRAIREVWGADSGTNVTKTETFYRDAVAYRYHLRVHPIPPDGLYTAWDYNAGVADRYYNSFQSATGVAIDGINDDLGNVDSLGGQPAFFDAPDPGYDVPVAVLKWEQVSGKDDAGSLVYVVENKGPTTATNPLVVPYYRDDKCFDDGTGDDPVARPWPGEATTDQRVQNAYAARAGVPYDQVTCDQKQGAWGEHGVHFFVTHDTDNGFVGTPVPVDEVDAQQWQFAVPTEAPAPLGEPYAQQVRVPLVATAAPLPNTADTPHATALELVGASSAQATDDAVVAARLVDTRDGEPVAGAPISFSLKDRVLAATTGADGIASVTFRSVRGPAGASTRTASFDGTDELVGASTSGPFEVLHEDTSLVVTAPSATVLSARLTETDTGLPLAGRTVRFVVDGTDAASGTTDGDGRATVLLTKRLKRNATVEGAFAGDDTYAGVRSRAS
jgi:hypothetical protein